MVTYNEDGTPDPNTVIPLVDGGTEGFKGHVLVVVYGLTGCLECTLDLYPPQVNFPLCTIAHTPRLPEHCIEYVRLLLWSKENPFGENVAIDGDSPEHIQWIHDQSVKRAQAFGITGITLRLVQGVVKRIIPAVASTNAVVAAACATEVFKLVTFCYNYLDNYMNFSDLDGVYTYTFSVERKPDCMACNNIPKDIDFCSTNTLRDVIDFLKNSTEYQMRSPNVTTVADGANKSLFIDLPEFADVLRQNLSKTLAAREPFASDPSWGPTIPPPPDLGPDECLSWNEFFLHNPSKPFIIDVRSPAEFSEDHIPNAVNIAVLNDYERAHVGRLHSEGSVLKARFLGASLICSNLSRILAEMGDSFPISPSSQLAGSSIPSVLSNCTPNLLVYCWRGGQRSNSLATLLAEIGWPSCVGVLVGGFKSWRRLVLRQLDAWPRWIIRGQFWVIAGLTGSGKSLVLSELNKAKETVLDLEELAHHKGSIFGAMPDDSQNTSCTLITQLQFESALHQKFTSDNRWQTVPRVWVECESRSVGPACHLSDGLWSRLRDTQSTHRVWLDVPEEARVAWIIESYSEFTKNPALLKPMLCSLAKYHPAQRITEWRSWIDAADFTSLVTGLLRHHYDPLYSKSRKSVMEEARVNGLVHRIPLSSVDACTIRSQLLPRLLSLACEHENVDATKQITA